MNYLTNYLQPCAFLALFALGACASTSSDTGDKNASTPDKSKKVATTTAPQHPPKTKKTIDNSASQQVNKVKDAAPAKQAAITKSVTTPQTPTAHSKQIAGLYFARLPCPGCGSVRVNLVLEPNFTYDKTEEYLASDDIFFDSGTWTIKDQQIHLSPSENTQSTIRLFRYEKGGLQLLTEQGTPYPGKADDYRFKKK